MALVFDNRHNLQGAPGLHALIAGVSLYKHLPNGGGPPAEENWDLSQLTATALTGYKIYRWLVDNQKRLPVGLATVRLLLSPSAKEAPKIAQGMSEIRALLDGRGPTLTDEPSPCTLANISAEAREWRKDARTHNVGVTLFYFAGHGIQRENNDPVMLLEDFGNPQVDFLTNSVVFKKLVAGMVPQADPAKKMARTQLYFVDACRVLPANLANYEFQDISNLLTGELGGVDDRATPVYLATIPNTLAFAKIDQQTLFSEALLQCLDGDGGVPTDEEDESGYAKWHVTTHSLSEALHDKLAYLKSLEVKQVFYSSPGGGPATIVKLDAPPEIGGTLEIDPDAALPFVVVEVIDERGNVVWKLSPVKPHPYKGRLRAGTYTLKANIADPPRPPYVDYWKSGPLSPPGFRLKAKVRS